MQAQQQVFEGLLCPLPEAFEGLLDPVAITWPLLRSWASAEKPCQHTWDQCRARRTLSARKMSHLEMLTSPVRSNNFWCSPPVSP